MSQFIHEAGIDFRRLLESEECVYLVKEIRSKVKMSLRYSHVRITQGHFGEKDEKKDFTTNTDSLNGTFERNEIFYPFRFIRAVDSSNLFTYFVLGRVYSLKKNRGEDDELKAILESGREILDNLSRRNHKHDAVILRKEDVSRLGLEQEIGMLTIQ